LRVVNMLSDTGIVTCVIYTSISIIFQRMIFYNGCQDVRLDNTLILECT